MAQKNPSLGAPIAGPRCGGIAAGMVGVVAARLGPFGPGIASARSTALAVWIDGTVAVFVCVRHSGAGALARLAAAGTKGGRL